MESGEETNAAERVFAIPELAESILLDVDLKTLLLSQRVSKTFNATIAGSIHLQRKLFFAPTPLPPGTECTGDSEDEPLQKNTLVLDASIFRPITTPEGYQFSVNSEWQEFFGEYDLTFTFKDKAPTLERPATGSWRKMRTHHVDFLVDCVKEYSKGEPKDRKNYSSAWYIRGLGIYEKKDATFGEMFDALMLGQPHHSQDIDRIPRSRKSRKILGRIVSRP